MAWYRQASKYALNIFPPAFIALLPFKRVIEKIHFGFIVGLGFFLNGSLSSMLEAEAFYETPLLVKPGVSITNKSLYNLLFDRL